MTLNKAAWHTAAGAHPFVVKQAPYIRPEPGEVLIQIAAIAMNPVDYKIQSGGARIPMQYPSILGADIAGTIVEIGDDVKDFVVGQRVIAHSVGFATGNFKASAFQHYTVLPTMVVTSLPDHITFESGVVLPLASDTAASALFQQDRLALPLPPDSTQLNGKALLVWGGSSSVGCTAIQLARAAGCEVIATASPRNHDLCISIGASAVFDYRSGTVVHDISTALKGKTMVGAFDCVGERSSTAACADVLADSEGGKMVVSVLSPPADLKLPTSISALRCMIPSMFESGLVAEFHAWLGKALQNGTVVPKPDPLIAGHGLEAIQGALDVLKKGVSAAKVIVTL